MFLLDRNRGASIRQKAEKYSVNNNCTQESGYNENAAIKLHTCHSYDFEKKYSKDVSLKRCKALTEGFFPAKPKLTK